MATTARSTLPLPTFRLIRLPAVMQKTGMGRSWIYARVKEGRFPAPISCGARAIAWNEADIDRWIQDCITAAGR